MSDVTTVWLWTVDVVAAGPSEMPDVSGYDVSARDGNIGKVEEVVNGADRRSYIVVDTGFWIFEKKRMIPAGAINTIDSDNKRIHVRLTKDEIRDAPDYEQEQRDSDTARSEHEKFYSAHASNAS